MITIDRQSSIMVDDEEYQIKEVEIDGEEVLVLKRVVCPPELKVIQYYIDIDVYPEDAPRTMPWDHAFAWCNQLGDGWRLPSRLELLALYEQRDIIGGFGSDYYWSSSEDGSYGAWGQAFGSGGQHGGYKDNEYRVRAVRSREAGE